MKCTHAHVLKVALGFHNSSWRIRKRSSYITQTESGAHFAFRAFSCMFVLHSQSHTRRCRKFVCYGGLVPNTNYRQWLESGMASEQMGTKHLSKFVPLTLLFHWISLLFLIPVRVLSISLLAGPISFKGARSRDYSDHRLLWNIVTLICGSFSRVCLQTILWNIRTFMVADVFSGVALTDFNCILEDSFASN